MGSRRSFDGLRDILVDCYTIGTMPFTKGDPNINREGRPPKGQSFTDVLNKILRETVNVNGTEMEKKEAIMRVLVREASNGQQWAVNALMDRIEGKPRQQIEQTIQTTEVPRVGFDVVEDRPLDAGEDN